MSVSTFCDSSLSIEWFDMNSSGPQLWCTVGPSLLLGSRYFISQRVFISKHASGSSISFSILCFAWRTNKQIVCKVLWVVMVILSVCIGLIKLYPAHQLYSNKLHQTRQHTSILSSSGTYFGPHFSALGLA